MHLLLLGLALAASASGTAKDAERAAYEAKVLAALEARAPEAVPDARAAGEAYAADRWDEVIAGYRRVLSTAPGFSHALRRICNAQVALGAFADAVASCREAVAADALAENGAALARALLAAAPGAKPAPDAAREANRLAHDALARTAAAPDRSIAASICDIALRTDDLGLLGSCSDALRTVAPDALETHYFTAIHAFSQGEHARARAAVAAAREAGLDPAAADELVAAIDADEPLVSRYGWPAAWAVLAWAVGLVALVLLGFALSAATLRAAARLARAPAGTASSGSRALRRIYGAVLWASCAYYYVSIPLVLLLVVGGGGAVLWGFWELGRIPVKLVLIVVFVVLATAWAVLKGVWVSVIRPPADVDPGPRVDPGTHPAFDEAVRTVAARVGTRPVDAVFLTPGAEVAVFERGGVTKQLTGRSERCLILGVGVLDGMTQGELKAVLAHEYGHLVNRDTAGGGFALAVRRSILTMGRALAEGGAATWYNPAWWFVLGFHKVFLRVSQGASRLQEILADRWAALAYGGRTFARGLEHAIAQGVRFDRHTQRTLREVIDGERALANLYRYVPANAEVPEELEAEIGKALDAEPSPYDSHPRPRDRMAWTAAIDAVDAPAPGDAGPAWSLFTDREHLEQQMTEHVREAVAANHGVTIPAKPPAGEGAAGGAAA
jgi:Zn-dependent protease with chaperone function